MPDPIDPQTPWSALADWWRWGVQAQSAWWTARMGSRQIEAARRQRLDALLAHAASESAFYRGRVAGVASPALERFEPVSKRELMANFDDWVTDPEVRLADLERFVADPSRIGAPYLGRYAVWTSSGSTGRPGIFVQDAHALSVYDALLTTRFPAASRGCSPFGTLAGGGRFAMVAAVEGHFAGVVCWERQRRAAAWMAAATRAFSVLAPLHEIVERLNAFGPAVVASYPTTLLLLARERRAGRLSIRPTALWSGGETLSPGERAEIADAFDAQVLDGYGASECMQIAFDCGHGALHLNADWVILEAIDARGEPVPAGTPSASCLLTNLANHVQPLVRYELGDSITYRATPCPCGSPFPALAVDGRRDDIVVLERADGVAVSLLPLAVATVVEDFGGVNRFQVIQTGARSLKVRFETPVDTAPDLAWARIVASLRAYLAQHGLEGVTIRRDPVPPRADPVSGKLREVLGMHPAARRTRGRTGHPRGRHDATTQ